MQALLPGLPLDWQVPLIADLAKAPVPLEVQNKPMEELVRASRSTRLHRAVYISCCTLDLQSGLECSPGTF